MVFSPLRYIKGLRKIDAKKPKVTGSLTAKLVSNMQVRSSRAQKQARQQTTRFGLRAFLMRREAHVRALADRFFQRIQTAQWTNI
jgi:hypothetical protein